jgi:hypothetical protein
MDVAERNKCSRAFRKTCLLLFMVPGTGFRSSTANLLIFLIRETTTTTMAGVYIIRSSVCTNRRERTDVEKRS